MQLPLPQSCSYSEDSVKWKAYSLLYEVKLKKFEDDGQRRLSKDDSIFNVVECDIKITSLRERGDTTEYLFDIIRNNPTDFYRQMTVDSYIGIGYVKKMCVYYPISGKTAFDVELDYYAAFWQEQDKKFIKFLKEYKGSIAPWLLAEVKKRKIL